MTVATFPAAKLWRGTEQFDAWLEFYGKDSGGADKTYPWAERFLSDASTYFGGRKDARVLAWGPYTLALSDRTGQLDGTSCTPTIADHDRLIRGMLANPLQADIPSTQVIARGIFESDRVKASPDDPAVLFRGLVNRVSGPAGLKASLALTDWFSQHIKKNVPLPTFMRQDFPNLDASRLAQQVPLNAGTHSDEMNGDAAPDLVADDSGRGDLHADGQTNSGFGDLPGTTPTSVTATETGAGTLTAGVTYCVMVTAVHGLVESNPSPFLGQNLTVTIAGATSAIHVAWTAASGGATRYRVYLGVVISGQPRWSQMIETTGTSCDFDNGPSDGSGTTAGQLSTGAVFAPYVKFWWYWAAWVTPTGESAATMNGAIPAIFGIAGPYKRPLRFAVDHTTKPADATAIALYRVDVGNALGLVPNARLESPLSQVNGGGDYYVLDLQDDTLFTAVTGLASPQGILPVVPVGAVTDQFGETWQAGVIGLGAHKAILNGYQAPATGGARVVSDSYSTTWAVPGLGSAFSTNFGSTLYYDGPSGYRYAVMYVRGPDGDDFASGARPIFVNAQTIEDVGDGSGTAIEDGPSLLLWFLRNFGLTETPWTGDVWATSDPTWSDGATRIDTASFSTFSTAMAATLTAGATRAWRLGSTLTIIDVLARIVTDLDGRFTSTKPGQFRLVLEYPDATNPAAVATLDETNSILADSHSFDDGTDPTWYFGRLDYTFAPTYAADGSETDSGAGSWGDLRAKPVAGSGTTRFFSTRSSSVAAELASRKQARASAPMRLIQIETSLNGLAIEPGDRVTLTHSESPWTGAHDVQVVSMNLDINSQKVGLACLDIALLGSGGPVGQGGGAVSGGSSSGAPSSTIGTGSSSSGCSCPTVTPGLPVGSVQRNGGGIFAGDENFKFDGSEGTNTKTVTIGTGHMFSGLRHLLVGEGHTVN